MTGDDIQTQRILDLDVIKLLKSLLSSPTDTILKETCWAISNITAGNVNQIQVYLTIWLFMIGSGIFGFGLIKKKLKLNFYLKYSSLG